MIDDGTMSGGGDDNDEIKCVSHLERRSGEEQRG